MERNTNAIVLRRRDSGESDRRLTLLTEEFGKLDAVAKGARKSASRLAGISDPLCVAMMTLAEGKVNRFITQAQPLLSFRKVRGDYDRLSLALALAEVVAAVLPYEEPFPEAYELLILALGALDAHPKPVVAAVWAQTRMMALAGFQPQLTSCVGTGEALDSATPWVSPQAGGYVCEEEAMQYLDRFRVRAEVLIGLERIAELDEPPGNLKLAEEACATLFPFWRHIADMPLPACETAVREVRHADV